MNQTIRTTNPLPASADVAADRAPAPTAPQPPSEADKAAATKLGLAGGAASGVATGVALGAATAGPVGAAVGGVICAVAGAAGGKALVEAIGPAADDDAYWADAYVREPYYRAERGYAWYRPAYEHGWLGVTRYPGSYEAAESKLAEDWLRAPGRNMDWDEARPAVRAAWERAAARRDAPVTGAPAAASATLADTDDAIDVLNGLLTMSRDGEDGFASAARHATTPAVRTALEGRARDCASAVIALQVEIDRLGGRPTEHGSVSAALHRGWTTLKTVFSSNDDKVVLDECVRAEEEAMTVYREALEKPLPAEARLLVLRQAEGVSRNYAEVLRMRSALPD